MTPSDYSTIFLALLHFTLLHSYPVPLTPNSIAKCVWWDLFPSKNPFYSYMYVLVQQTTCYQEERIKYYYRGTKNLIWNTCWVFFLILVPGQSMPSQGWNKMMYGEGRTFFSPVFSKCNFLWDLVRNKKNQNWFCLEKRDDFWSSML